MNLLVNNTAINIQVNVHYAVGMAYRHSHSYVKAFKGHSFTDGSGADPRTLRPGGGLTGVKGAGSKSYMYIHVHTYNIFDNASLTE